MKVPSRTTPTRRSGFTLVELLVVIGIIALLISILLPSLNQAREKALTVNCAANLRSMGQTVHMFANDNDLRVPAAQNNARSAFPWFPSNISYEDFRPMVSTYGYNANVMVCPSVAFRDLEVGVQPFDDYSPSLIYFSTGQNFDARDQAGADAYEQIISDKERNYSSADFPTLWADGNWASGSMDVFVDTGSYMYFGANRYAAGDDAYWQVNKITDQTTKGTGATDGNPVLSGDRAHYQVENNKTRANHGGEWQVLEFDTGVEVPDVLDADGNAVFTMEILREEGSPRLNVLRTDSSVSFETVPDVANFMYGDSGKEAAFFY